MTDEERVEFKGRLDEVLAQAEGRSGTVWLHPQGYKAIRDRYGWGVELDQNDGRDMLRTGVWAMFPFRRLEVRIDGRMPRTGVRLSTLMVAVLPPAGYVGATLYKPPHA